MPREQAPAFQFYPRDFVGDFDVAAMTLEQSGAYAVLLSYAWLKNGLPNDLPRLARALHVSGKRFDVIWQQVGQKFSLAADGRLRNPRQEEERGKQIENRTLGGQGGKASAEARRQKFGSANPRANREPECEPDVNRPVHKRSEPNVNSSSSLAVRTETTRAREAPVSTGPHRSHAFCGRVCVPAALHTEFVRKLGTLDADETLRAWYRQVDDVWQPERHPEVITGSDFDFWRARWREKYPTEPVAGRGPISAKYRQQAEALRRESYQGRCPHTPACLTAVECISEIAVYLMGQSA